jgi:hypothetical protein
VSNYIPFLSPRTPPPLVLGDFSIPRYGSLTLNESWALEDFLGAGMSELGGLAATLEGDRLLQAVLVTILLVSRGDRGWTLDQSIGLADSELQAATAFFLGERRRWRDGDEKPLDGDEEKPQSGELDWGLLFRRLQLAYPNDPDFTRENFGNCPIARLEQALESLNQVELERNYREARAIAHLGIYLLSAKGAKDMRTEMFNPFEQILIQRQAKKDIDRAAARLFLELVAESKVPGWVVAIVDVGVVRLAAD